MIVAPARCWITISQARFGAEAADFAASTHIMSASGTVLSYDPPDKSLGYLWSAPRRGYPLSERGLGHSITWAWDPELCDALLPMFSETFYALSLIGNPSRDAASVCHMGSEPSDHLVYRCD